MASFRNYKKYNVDDTSSIDDYWASSTHNFYGSKIPSKGIFRAFGDFIKYGNMKNEVLR